MARPRKYVIKLTDDELKTLKSIIRKSNTSKTIRSRCQIIIDFEYSCAATPQIRQTGNRLSGLAETVYASLLAQCFV